MSKFQMRTVPSDEAVAKEPGGTRGTTDEGDNAEEAARLSEVD